MKTKLVEGRMCGTCKKWERKHAISSRVGALIPNAKCRCNAEVEIPSTFPSSIQKVETLYDEGVDCQVWKDILEKVEVIDWRE